MKKIFIFLLAIALAGTQSCKKHDNNPQPDPQPENKELTMLGVTGFIGEFAISSSGSWTVEIPAGITWLEVDKKNGTGDATLKFTIAQSVASAQETTVKIMLNGKQVNLVVKTAPFYTNTSLKMLAGQSMDDVLKTIATTDGGYLLAGTTGSTTGDFNDNPGGNKMQAFAIKYDQTGVIQWRKYFGGKENEEYAGGAQTADGGFVLVGHSMSKDGEFAGNKGNFDMFVQKLSKDGVQEWLKFFGSTKGDYGGDVVVAQDGSVFVTGLTEGSDGDFTGNHGDSDLFLACLDNTGTVKWKKCYGGSDYESGRGRLTVTSDGNPVITSFTGSTDGDLTNTGNQGDKDVWLCKVNAANGNLIWSKTYGGNDEDNIIAIIATEDGGAIAAGSTYSSSIFGEQVKGTSDGFVLKINNEGVRQWSSLIDDNGSELFYSIASFRNTGFLLAGINIDDSGVADGMLCLIDGTGKKRWTKKIGGSNLDFFTNVATTKDDTVIATGFSMSNDGDIPGNAGDFDIMVHKFR